MTSPRILAVLALTLALLGAAGTADARAPAEDRSRVVVAFMPSGGRDNPARLVDRLRARPQLALGLMSMTQGIYSASQTLLDLSSGNRTSRAAYEPRGTPGLSLVLGGDGRGFVFKWSRAVARARSAIADVRPGLLASSVPGGIAYVGLDHRPNIEAIAAADRDGRIASIDLGSSRDEVRRVAGALRRYRVVMAGLATGDKGDATLDALIAARRPADLLLVLQTPPVGIGLKLLPAGGAGLEGGAGALTSDTTHLKGVVSATDVPATILDRLGVDAPAAMRGQPIRSEGGRNLDALETLQDRLNVMSARRNPTAFALLFGWLALVLVLGLVADRRGILAGMRIGALGVMWLLPLLLLAGALQPSRPMEFAIVVGGGLVLGALTDRLVRWPRAPVVPCAVAIASYAIDLAWGSPLIIRSLLGVNPRSGSRFYGLGNELEAALAVLALVGVAAVLSGRPTSRRAAGLFAAVGVALGIVVGSGRLGADVGGVITVGTGAAVAAVLMLPGELTRRRVLIAIATPLAGLAALAVLDLATAGNGHFTRTVLDARSGEALWDVAKRRYTLAYDVLSTGAMPFLTVLALLAAAYAFRFRARIYASVDGSPAWSAALIGGLTGSLVGSLTNDSGPILLIFGVFLLASATAYLRGQPASDGEQASMGASG